MTDKVKKRSLLIKLEDKFFKWVIKRRYAIFTFIVCGLFLIVLLFIPYVNVFLNRELLVFVVIILAMLIFNVSLKRIVIFSLFLISIGLPLILLERYETAERLGNFAYGICFLGIIKIIIEGVSD